MEHLTTPTVSPYSSTLTMEGTTDEFFPEGIDPGVQPFGHRVLVQLKRTKTKTGSGIILARDTKDTEAWNTQVARVVALGPLAFRKRDTAEAWPEGTWAMPGDYVRTPRWGGDRWSVDMDDGGDPVVFMMLADHELIGKITGDPLKVRAYLL